MALLLRLLVATPRPAKMIGKTGWLTQNQPPPQAATGKKGYGAMGNP